MTAAAGTVGARELAAMPPRTTVLDVAGDVGVLLGSGHLQFPGAAPMPPQEAADRYGPFAVIYIPGKLGAGAQVRTTEQLDELWRAEDVLLRGSGTCNDGSGFSDCWVRPVPRAAGGAPGTWEVLLPGETPSPTHSNLITTATVLHAPGPHAPQRVLALASARAGTPADAGMFAGPVVKGGS